MLRQQKYDVYPPKDAKDADVSNLPKPVCHYLWIADQKTHPS